VKASSPGTYYAWLKDFMKAGKERLTRDTVRDAAPTEVQELKCENARLKTLVAELSLEVYVLKNGHTTSGVKRRYERVGAREKEEILSLMADSGLPCVTALAKLGLPRSSYYCWLKGQSEGRLEDKRGRSRVPWNKISRPSQ